jgi:alpha-ribazole phosphatase
MAMRIWLIRHGLTALGEEKRYQGSTDTPLSDAGRLALQPDDRFARVYCSPLLRAVETARILFPSAEKRMVPDLRRRAP